MCDPLTVASLLYCLAQTEAGGDGDTPASRRKSPDWLIGLGGCQAGVACLEAYSAVPIDSKPFSSLELVKA